MQIQKSCFPLFLLFGVFLAFPLSGEPPVTEADSIPSIAKRVTGLDRHEGFISYWWDSRKGKVLLEVPANREEFLYGSGIASGAGLIDGALDRGAMGPLSLCRFERAGPRVLLVELQTTNRSGSPDGEQTRVVEESFPTSVLASLTVEAAEGERVVVDATQFLLRDTEIASALARAGQGDWRQDIERSAFFFDRSGAFPLNTEIEVIESFTADKPSAEAAAVAPDGRTMSLHVHRTFRELPEPGYLPRTLDPRIGFIPLFYRDQTAPYSDPIERYLASRWRLDREHPHILYYLDRGIPEPERKAIGKAALWWNHAFAEAGFPEALILRDLPEGATFLDARYSGIEWINRVDRSWSFGEIQVDPRTGEILHAVARIDSHRRRTTARMWRNLERPRPGLACGAADAPDYSWLALEAPGLDEESLVLERLRYLAAHEVGHTLGLMHNWAATTFGWGSVMDYLAPNIQWKNGDLDLSDAYPADIGSYDHLMIRWGYTPSADPGSLEKIVRDGYDAGIFYPLESDPRWAEYDHGADPVEWLRTTLSVRGEILRRFGAAQLKSGQRVYDLQERFSLAYLYHRFAIQAAQRFVGGQYQTNALAGDRQKPVEWVSPAEQRKALSLLIESLRPENLDVPESIEKVLVDVPQGEFATRESFSPEAGASFSALGAARALAALIVRPLLDPARAARLTLDQEPDAPGLGALCDRLIAATWKAARPESARLARLGRIAQRTVLDAMIELSADSGATTEVRAVTLEKLVELRRLLSKPSAIDPETRAQVELARCDLGRYLDHPESWKAPEKPPQPPPGRPIGVPPQ